MGKGPSGYVECKLCGGTGRANGYDLRNPCQYCDSRGYRRKDQALTERCTMCGGSGRKLGYLSGQACEFCKGYGLRRPCAAEVDQAGVELVYIEAGKPHTARKELRELIAPLAGEVHICDPYMGDRTLANLDSLLHRGPIQFLTGSKARTRDDVLLKDYQSEHSQVEFRRHGGGDLHDRYILTQDHLVLLGHGLKDLGGRESFGIRLGKDEAEEVIETVRREFDRRWSAAAPIT